MFRITNSRSTIAAVCCLLITWPQTSQAASEFGLGLGYVQDCPIATTNSDPPPAMTSNICYHGGRVSMNYNFLFREATAGPRFSPMRILPMYTSHLVAGAIAISAMIVFGVVYGVLIFFLSEAKVGLFYLYDHQGKIDDGGAWDPLDQYRAYRVGMQANLYPTSLVDIQIILGVGYANASYDQQEAQVTTSRHREGYSIRIGLGYEPTAKISGPYFRYEYERLFFEPTNLATHIANQDQLALPDYRKSGAFLLGYKWGTGGSSGK